MEDLSVQDARDLIMESAGPDEDAAPSSEQIAAVLHEAQQIPAGSDDQARAYAGEAVGLGVDIVEIDRMARILERTPAFAERVFSPAEREYCDSMANPATHYALRFAAREAIVKALGTGFAQGIGVHDIEVQRAKSGKPLAKLSGRALEIAEEQGVRDLSLSLSYTHTDAVACAMAVTEASIRASEKRKDPKEELARQFKEVRGILDDL